MKKKFAFIISLVLCLVLCISLVACNNKDNNGNNDGNNGGNANEHTAKSAWSSDETEHWHDCATEGHTDKLDKAAHTWNDGEVTTEPTYTANGVKTYTCTVCEAKKTESVAKLSPKDNTITVGKIEFVYNAKSQPIDSLVTAGNKEGMVIEYVGDGETTYEKSTTAPTNAGTYQYTITIPATAEWKAAEVSGKFTIAKYELTMVCEKQRIEYDGKAEENGTKRIWFPFNTLEDNTEVRICVMLESANVGAKVSDYWLPERLRTNNYTFDINNVQIEIVAKKLSNLYFEIKEEEVDFTRSEQTITREIAGANNEKVIVEITFSPEELDNEEGLELSFDGIAGATCKIKFQTETTNYVLDLTGGELKLVRPKTA